jgi:polyphosphate kinase
VHLGAGNYNERTARVYTDVSLMTAAPAIAEDATAFFSALTGYSDPPRLKKLVMAPTHLRRRFLQLIDRERRRAETGQPAEIVAKMNSLVDEEIIDALYRASQAGVAVRLNVRGICALRPGVPGVSDNIEVVSILDRFLEHSRVYYFYNNGEPEVYCSSADWMPRNFFRRVETCFPIEDERLRARVVDEALLLFLADNTQAWELQQDGSYKRLKPGNRKPRNAQAELLRELANA